MALTFWGNLLVSMRGGRIDYADSLARCILSVKCFGGVLGRNALMVNAVLDGTATKH